MEVHHWLYLSCKVIVTERGLREQQARTGSLRGEGRGFPGDPGSGLGVRHQCGLQHSGTRSLRHRLPPGPRPCWSSRLTFCTRARVCVYVCVCVRVCICSCLCICMCARHLPEAYGKSFMIGHPLLLQMLVGCTVVLRIRTSCKPGGLG